MQLFYTPDLAGDSYTLNETESKHCIRVLRLSEGDSMYLTNGKGLLCKASITDASAKKCQVRIVEQSLDYGKRAYKLHIAIAPTKNIDRIEWFLEKATEIGIDEITPLLCHHSERKVIKPERLNKVIEAAMKQSLKAYHPVLHPLTPFKYFVEQQWATQQFIAHCADAPKINLKDGLNTPSDAVVLIGPEGDFAEQEIELALRHNYQAVSLSESRLRTETAGLLAVSTVNLFQ